MSALPRVWQHRTGEFRLGERTLIMGVLNVTPDSFSDGGRHFTPEEARVRAAEIRDQGADLLDVGAESTRPGSPGVPEDEQLRRLLPVLETLGPSFPIPISVDTRSARVAKECIAAGASIVNDVSGFGDDPELPDVCADAAVGVVLMHMRGAPATMQSDVEYGDLIGEIRQSLKESTRRARSAGIESTCILIDPGIGFGKSFEQNHRLIGSLHRFRDLAAGVLVGTSRKGFTGEFSKLPPEQRQYSTAATVAICCLHGADVVRVHDVTEMKQVVDICDRFRQVRAAD